MKITVLTVIAINEVKNKMIRGLIFDSMDKHLDTLTTAAATYFF